MKKILVYSFIHYLNRIYCSEDYSQEKHSIHSSSSSTNESITYHNAKLVINRTSAILQELEKKIVEELNNTFENMTLDLNSKGLESTDEFLDLFNDLTTDVIKSIDSLSNVLDIKFKQLSDEYYKNSSELYKETSESIIKFIDQLKIDFPDESLDNQIIDQLRELVQEKFSELNNASEIIFRDFKINYLERIKEEMIVYKNSLEIYSEKLKTKLDMINGSQKLEEDDLECIFIITLKKAEKNLFENIQQFLNQAEIEILVPPMTDCNTENFYNMNSNDENPLNLLAKHIMGNVSCKLNELTDIFYAICESELKLLASYFEKEKICLEETPEISTFIDTGYPIIFNTIKDITGMIINNYYDLSGELMEDSDNLYKKIYQRISNKGDNEIHSIRDQESSAYISYIKTYTNRFYKDLNNYQIVIKDKISKLVSDIERVKSTKKGKGYMALDKFEYHVNKIINSLVKSIQNTKNIINGFNIEGKISAKFKMV